MDEPHVLSEADILDLLELQRLTRELLRPVSEASRDSPLDHVG